MADNSDQKTETNEPVDKTPAIETIDAPTTPDTPTAPPTDLKAKVKHHLSNRKKLVIIALVLLLAGGAAFALLRKPAKKAEPTPVVAQTNPQPTAPPAKPKADSTFLDTPLKLADQKIFADLSYFGQECLGPNGTDCKNSTAAADIAYFQIGTTKTGDKIIVARLDLGLQKGEYILLGKADKTYTLLYRMTADVTSEYYKDEAKRIRTAVASNVTVDEETELTDLTFPKTASVKDVPLSLVDSYFIEHGLPGIRGSIFGKEDTVQPTKIGEAKDHTFYQVTANSTETYAVKEIYATVGSVYAGSYTMTNEFTERENPVPDNWTKGDKTSSIYFSSGGGCGSRSGYIEALNIKDSDVTQVGTSAGNMPLYQLPTSHPLVKELYEKDYAGGEINEAPYKGLTIDQFTNKHGYVLIKNGLGDYVVYLRPDMIFRGGCAKPVVYLYPTKTTQVSVKVGADVTKSEPAYGAGWTATAQPNGQLTVGGKPFDSLFWEGLGHGSYPDVTGVGVAVPLAQVPNTLKQQLAAQGLNAKESQDFLDYWLPKIPNTPYVRLTWLGNKELNQLAPLNISPLPNTTIRVFLDFEGLQAPQNLRAQKFIAPARRGFTVVEWGGLLRGL